MATSGVPVELTGIAKSYGSRTVIESLDLTIERGSFTVLVGPSGCGKSTTLRVIAGLEKPSSGSVRIGDRDVTTAAPGDRGVAMVFQNYAIYPTMTVEKNIEYGLRNSGVPKDERRALVSEIAETVGLTSHLKKSPGALSGGERQRVALARAMVRKPDVFLMDEPLSNLDARLRQQMRAELVDLHQRLGATFVYVTHDQVEAMSMGDRIVLMNAGQIMQADTPPVLYREPANVFTAQFIGSPGMNIVSATSIVSAPDGAASVGFRPEHAAVIDPTAPIGTDQIRLSGTLVASEYLGAETVDRIRLHDGGQISIRTFEGPWSNGHRQVDVTVPRMRLHWFDKAGIRLKGAEVR